MAVGTGNKYIELGVDGDLVEKRSVQVSTGVGDAGAIISLGPDGFIDESMFSSNEVRVVVFSEAVAAGKYVNLYNNAGVLNARLADNSNGRTAHGRVKAAVASAASGTVYSEGDNMAISGLTASGFGLPIFLGTAGGLVQTKPVAPASCQILGIALSATSATTEIERPINQVV